MSKCEKAPLLYSLVEKLTRSRFENMLTKKVRIWWNLPPVFSCSFC